jgi:hypothetical protein
MTGVLNKKRSGQGHTQNVDLVKTQGEDSFHLLRRKEPCPHLDLGLQTEKQLCVGCWPVHCAVAARVDLYGDSPHSTVAPIREND